MLILTVFDDLRYTVFKLFKYFFYYIIIIIIIIYIYIYIFNQKMIVIDNFSAK